MKIPINQLLSASFNTDIPPGVLLPMVPGGEKQDTPQVFKDSILTCFSLCNDLTPEQRANELITKSIFDTLVEKGAEPSTATEIPQESSLLPINPGPIQNEQSELILPLPLQNAPVLSKENVPADVKAPIVDAPNSPVTGIPVEHVIARPQIPNIQMQESSITYNPDIPEQKNDALPDPQEKGNQQVNVQGQVLTKESPEKAPFNFLTLSAPQPSPGAIKINNQKQETTESKSGNDKVYYTNDTKEDTTIQKDRDVALLHPNNGNESKAQSSNGVGRVVTAETNPLAQQTPVLADSRGMIAQGILETIVEEITNQRTAEGKNNVTPQGLVNALEKLVEHQNTFNTNPSSAPDESPLSVMSKAKPLASSDTGAMRILETIVEEITIQRTAEGKNNVTPQGLVNALEKLLEHQNTFNTNPSPAPAESPVLVTSKDKPINIGLPEIDLLSTLQKASNKDTPPLLTPLVPDEQKPNLAFALSSDRFMESETNNKLSLLNRILQELHITKPKVMINDISSKHTVASNDAVEATDVNTNEMKGKIKHPQTTLLPLNVNNIKPQDMPYHVIDKQTTVHQDTAKEHTKNIQVEPDIELNPNKSNKGSNDPAYSESNPWRHAAKQNPLTPPMDTKIHTNTQTAGQTDTGAKAAAVAAETRYTVFGKESDPSLQPADAKHTEAALAEGERKTSPQNLPFSPQEMKTTDSPLPKTELISSDVQHKNTSTMLATNEQNASVSTSLLEGLGSQSVKEVQKTNNPQQIPEPYYNNIIEQIAQKVRTHLREGKWDMNLRLDPPELGSIKLRFSVTGNRLEASIEVEKLNVMQAIERDIPRLKESISSAGIDVGRLDVLFHEGNDGRNRPYLAQQTNHETQNATEEDTDIETVEKADQETTLTGVNNALDIDRIDYIA
jgi:flagellar hook-length control protein FliK